MPRDTTNAHFDLPELSNEDVAILYEIINVSSQSPDIRFLPFRAIFAAYDTVLAKHGISPAHDQLYLRFLFRLGERLGPAADSEERDLFTEFEALLLELGIKIEVGGDGESVLGSDEVQAHTGHPNDGGGRTETHVFTDADTFGSIAITPRRARRASFSEILDIEESVSKANRTRPDSPASISRLQNTSDGFGSKPFTRRKLQGISTKSIVDEPNLMHKSRENNVRRRDAVALPSQDLWDARGSLATALARHGRGQQAKQHERRTGATNFEIYEDQSVQDFLPARSRPRESDLYVSKQNSAGLAREAEIFVSFRLQRLTRTIVKKWNGLSSHRQRQRAQLSLLAVQYDRRELVKQAWNEWLDKHRERQNAKAAEQRKIDQLQREKEHELYLQWRETSASKARDVYLVAKAFSHWANHTAEIIEENAVARRHVIRLRYFTAWKEVTAVNDIKVRRTVLRKFLSLWQRRIHNFTAQQQESRARHKHNLLQSAYWNWFWAFCERRAPEWHNAKLKQRCLLIWAGAVRRHRLQNGQVGQKSREDGQYAVVQRWTDRLRQLHSLGQQADLFRREALARRALSNWITLTRLAEPARKISNRVKKRIVSSAIGALCYSSGTYQQAKRIDQKSVTRRTWTLWNDELRVRTMQLEINDRIVTQALYKWVVAERGALMKRVHDERLQQQLLHDMLEKSAMVRSHLQGLEEKAQDLRNHALARAVLSVWQIKYGQYRKQEEEARAFRLPRAATRTIHLWHAAHEHQMQLARWSVESAFYFRGKRSIKKWNNACKESQKRKRREAYTAVKRTYNRNLASTAFRQWRSKSRDVQELQIREHDLQVNRAEKLLSSVVDHWSRRLQDNYDNLNQASSHDAEKTTSGMLRTWSAQTRLSTANVTTASSLYDTRVQRAAYDSLRRLQLKTLELQSHHAKAYSLQNWNSRRRVRGLLKAWAERAASRRLGTHPSGGYPPGVPQSDSGPLLLQGMSLLSLARTPRATRRGQPSPVTSQSIVQQASPENQQPRAALVDSATQPPTYPGTPSLFRSRRLKAASPQDTIQSNYRPQHAYSQSQLQSQSQSHTPPTSKPQPHFPLSIRFAEEHTAIESPLRIPEPTRTTQSKSSFQQVPTINHHSTAQRRQYLPRARFGTSGLAPSLTSSVSAMGPGSEPRDTGGRADFGGTEAVGNVNNNNSNSNSLGGDTGGVRRSLFPDARRKVKNEDEKGDDVNDDGAEA